MKARLRKTKGKKLKLAKAERESRPAPRWLDIKTYGLGKARYRAIKRFRGRHWKRSKRLKV